MSSPSIIAANNDTQILGSDILNLQLDLTQNKRLPALSKISLPALVGSQAGQLLRHAYLRFEHISGHGVSPVYDVYLNLPTAAQTSMDTQLENRHFAGSLGFYGLEQSSTPSLEHDGSGMNLVLDVADLLNDLRSRSDWDMQTLHINLRPREPMAADASAQIGRVSLHVELA